MNAKILIVNHCLKVRFENFRAVVTVTNNGRHSFAIYRCFKYLNIKSQTCIFQLISSKNISTLFFSYINDGIQSNTCEQSFIAYYFFQVNKTITYLSDINSVSLNLSKKNIEDWCYNKWLQRFAFHLHTSDFIFVIHRAVLQTFPNK